MFIIYLLHEQIGSIWCQQICNMNSRFHSEVKVPLVM